MLFQLKYNFPDYEFIEEFNVNKRRVKKPKSTNNKNEKSNYSKNSSSKKETAPEQDNYSTNSENLENTFNSSQRDEESSTFSKTEDSRTNSFNSEEKDKKRKTVKRPKFYKKESNESQNTSQTFYEKNNEDIVEQENTKDDVVEGQNKINAFINYLLSIPKIILNKFKNVNLKRKKTEKFNVVEAFQKDSYFNHIEKREFSFNKAKEHTLNNKGELSEDDIIENNKFKELVKDKYKYYNDPKISKLNSYVYYL